MLYALTARLPSGGSKSVAILEQITYITSELNAFFIRQPIMMRKEIEKFVLRKHNYWPKHHQTLPLSNVAKQYLKLHEFSRESPD